MATLAGRDFSIVLLRTFLCGASSYILPMEGLHVVLFEVIFVPDVR